MERKVIFRFYSAQSRRVVGDIECVPNSIEHRRLRHAGYQYKRLAPGETWDTAWAQERITINRLGTDAEFTRIQLLAADTGAPAVPRSIFDELEFRLTCASLESVGGKDYGSLYFFYFQSWDKLAKVDYRAGSAIKGADSFNFFERDNDQDEWQHLASATPTTEAELNALYDQVFSRSKMPARWQWKPLY